MLICMCELIEGENREGGEVCGHISSSLAVPFITLLSQLQTKPQCGASLLKSQHDKNSWIEVAQPTLPWHMGYFLLSLVCVVDWDCDRTLKLAQSLPKHVMSWQTVICVPQCVYVCQCDDNHEPPEPAELIPAALSRELKNRDIQIFFSLI